MAVSLKNSGLISSGAFKVSKGANKTDEVLVFDPTATGYNKTPTRIFTYSGGAWHRKGVAGDAGDSLVFRPGSGVIIRKNVDANAETSLWTNPSSYPY